MKEHPEDVANRKRCQKFANSKAGRALAGKIISEKELWRMILVYPDSGGHDLLDRLRERFWSREEIP